MKRWIVGFALIVVLAICQVSPASVFTAGDVFIAAGNGQIYQYDAAGVYKDTLNTGISSLFVTGMAWDPGGDLYVTNFSASNITRLTSPGTVVPPNPYVYGDHPWTGRQIAEAVSDDGLEWRELGFVRPDSDAPANHVPEALAIEEGGETWIVLFYACQNGGEPVYDYRYSRIRYMKRACLPEGA